MACEIRYNMHNIVRFRVLLEKDRLLFPLVNDMYSYFRDDSVGDFDITLRIGRFVPQTKSCRLVDHKYHVRDDYIYCEEEWRGIRWRLQITGFESRRDVLIEFCGKTARPWRNALMAYHAQNQLLRPMVDIILTDRGFFPLHGIALEKNGAAVAMAARGGAHKTMIASEALRHPGLRLMGDDRIILADNGIALCYPVLLDLLLKKVCTTDGTVSSTSDRIRVITGMINHSANSRAHDCANIVANRADLRKLLIGARKRGTSTPTLRNVGLTDVTKRLTSSNFKEMTSCGIERGELVHFLDYMNAYSYAFPWSKNANHWNLSESVLRRNLENVVTYNADLPMEFSPSLFHFIHRMLSREVQTEIRKESSP